MPELPEVETVCRGLQPVLVGQRIVRVLLRRGDLRIPFPPDFAERLTGRTILRIARRAKYILATCDDGTVLVVHLGMSGGLRVHPTCEARCGLGRHDHVVITLENGTRVVYSDPRRFGVMTLAHCRDLKRHALLRDLGLEPLAPRFDGAALGAGLARRRTSIKAALLDQHVVAGLGNIYVCEALHLARISPRRQAYTVTGARAARLAAAIRTVLKAAIAAGGSSLRDYAHADGSLGLFQYSFAVYGREGAPCPTPGCGAKIRRLVQNNRSTFYCPGCQR